MFRVIAVRSLKFSEHRDNQNTKMEENEVIVKKRTESYKGQRRGDQFNVANKYSELDKLQTPSVVAEIIKRECIKRKKEPHGVWSAMGVAYNMHGTPDLELGEAKNLSELKKRARKDNKKLEVSAKDGDNVQSRQQLNRLVNLFVQTKESLSRVNLFNRGGPGEEGSKGGRFQKNKKKKKNDNSEDRETHHNKDRGPKTWEQMKTTERLAALPQWKNNMKQGPKQVKTKTRDKLKHLKESRLEHLERWRSSFEQANAEKKDQMIQALVERGNDREQVYADSRMFNRAQRLVSIKLRDRWSEKEPVQQQLQEHKSIWQRTKHIGDVETWDDPFPLTDEVTHQEGLKKLKEEKRRKIIAEQRRIAQEVNAELANKEVIV